MHLRTDVGRGGYAHIWARALICEFALESLNFPYMCVFMCLYQVVKYQNIEQLLLDQRIELI